MKHSHVDLGRLFRWRFSPPVLTAGAVFMCIVFTIIWFTDSPSPPAPAPAKLGYSALKAPQVEFSSAEQTLETQTEGTLETQRDSDVGETGNTSVADPRGERVPQDIGKTVGPGTSVGKGHYTPPARDPDQERRARLHEIHTALREFPQGRITREEFAQIQALRNERLRLQRELGQFSTTQEASARLDIEIQTILEDSMFKDPRGFRVSDAPLLIQKFKKAGAFDMADKFQKAANKAAEDGEAFFTIPPEN